VVTTSRKQLLPAKAVLTAGLMAIVTGLLIEGIMIGPEYRWHNLPHQVLHVPAVLAVFRAWHTCRGSEK
jgi:hypothetical protein